MPPGLICLKSDSTTSFVGIEMMIRQERRIWCSFSLTRPREYMRALFLSRDLRKALSPTSAVK